MTVDKAQAIEEHARVADWLEIAELMRAAPHATDGAQTLLTLYSAGRLSIEALKDGLRTLVVLR